MDINSIYDKINRCVQMDIPVFTDFLDYAGLLQLRTQVKIPRDCFVLEYTGFKDDERRIIGFFPVSYRSFMDEEALLDCFPIQILEIESDFSVNPFGHRDLLGAVLGLGLERKLFGDMVFKGQKAYIFCHERGGDLLLRELVHVGRGSVSVTKVSRSVTCDLEPKSQEIRTTVASMRLDGIIKAIGGVSRTAASQLIVSGQVKVNQRIIGKTHEQLKVGDILSIRGIGKFKVKEIGALTKKKRIVITILKYI